MEGIFFRRSKRRREDSNKINHKKGEFGNYCTHKAQIRHIFWVFVNKVMNFRAP